jgi:flagellar motility protein MotE (MotC chaperone)
MGGRRSRRCGPRRWPSLALAASIALLAGRAEAQKAPEPGPSAAPGTATEPGKAEAARAPHYCGSIANAAADARFAWQKDALAALAKDVEARISRLEAKRAEYETWLARRQAFLAKADESVTAIYAKMRPDAASQQLTAMDTEAAAAILTRLDVRVASAIMNEMEPGRAARLANVITSTPKRTTPPKVEDVKASVPSAPPSTDGGDRPPQDSETSG